MLTTMLSACLYSCRDDMDLLPKEDPNDISFIVSLPDEATTRTYYGTEETFDGKTVWPIYWNSSSMGYDKIEIFAPNAMATRNQATYTVQTSEDDKVSSAKVVKVGDTGIQWGTSATKFYGFYPGNKEFDISFSGSKVTATMPANQSIEKLVVGQNGFVINDKDPDYVYSVKGSMDCCMMGAATEEYSVDSDNISLSFTPVSTALNINIQGPESNFMQPVNVTSVTITSNAQISGAFTYDLETGEFAGLSSDPSKDGTDEIVVSTLYEGADQVMRGIPLYNGQKMNLQAFILPNSEINTLTVKVMTADGRVWTKGLTLENNGNKLLKPGEIHTCMLPPFSASKYTFDFSTWISQLDPRIYISELSLPGSALSTNMATYSSGASSGLASDQITQTETISNQFKAGIRVFDVGVWVKEGKSLLDDGIDTRIYIADSKGNDTGLNLVPFTELLVNEMNSNHADEFCVLMIAPMDPGNSNYTASDLYVKLKGTLDLMQQKGMLPSEPITANTRIYDVRDKVIIKYQISPTNFSAGTIDEYNEQLTNISNWPKYFDDVDCWFNIWTSYATSNPSSSQLIYGESSSNVFGSFEFNEATASGSTFHNASFKDDPKPVSGLATTVFEKYTDTANYSWHAVNPTGYRVSTDLQYPLLDKTEMASGEWYIFCDQSNAGANMSTVEGNQGRMATAITSTYDASTHNKFYMTYCGGVGNSSTNIFGQQTGNTIDQVTANLNKFWNENFLDALRTAEHVTVNSYGETIADSSGEDPTYIPFGWVLVNQVNLTEVNNPATTNTTAKIIQAVIGNNGQQNLILQRDKDTPLGGSVSVVSKASQAIANKVTNGGSLFKSRRR